jgi:hypothetical protein
MEEIINNKDIGINRAKTIAGRIQKVYFVLICITAMLFLYNLSEGIIYSVPKPLADFIVYFIVYISLRYRKRWAIPIVLISSASGLGTSFLSSLVPAEELASLSGKAMDIFIVLFSAYQLHFFSKKEVRELFNFKGTIIF